MRVSIVVAVSALLCAAFPAAGADYHLILSGSGGQESFQQQFADWGDRLRTALVKQAHVPEDRILWLSEDNAFQHESASDIDLESIETAFRTIQSRLAPGDTAYVYLIGHGSYYGGVSKFHIPGVDATADNFARCVGWLGDNRVVMINAMSSGAAFINALSGENRILCSATKGVGEFNATEFMEFFIQALEDGSADRNRDERISVYEICRQASELTAGYYTAEGLIATEHAIIDDNADGLGTRLADPETVDGEPPEHADGALARATYLRDYVFPDYVPQKTIDAYLTALDEIDALKARKPEMDEDLYYAELEPLLIAAARANRAIKTLTPPE